MRKTYLITTILFLLLVACNPAEPTGTATVPVQSNPNTEDTVPPLATAPAATALPGSYPVFTPTNIPLPPGYPESVVATLPPKYPSDEEVGRVWVLRPLGVQCTEADTYEFPTLNDAVRSLEGAGIEVFGAEVVGLMVCEACDCPTSEHYRVQIGVEHLATATQMGWSVEREG